MDDQKTKRKMEPTNQLTDIYCKHVRSILEYAAAAVWHAGLTLENPPNIE